MDTLYTDSRAPWNEKESEGVVMDKRVMLSISKVMPLTTLDTITEEDEDGVFEVARKDANWIEAYENDSCSLSEMLKVLEIVANEKAEVFKEDKNLSKYWKKIAENCKGWIVEEIEVDEP